MKSFLKRIFIGFMLSLLGLGNMIFLGFIVFIFTNIHTVNTAWDAIVCFIGALILLAFNLLFIYLTGLIPQITNKEKVGEKSNE